MEQGKNILSLYINAIKNKNDFPQLLPFRGWGPGVSLIRHSNYRHNHLFQTYPAMLKGVAVIVYIVIIVIGIT
jgi:hypothetical protein